MDAGGFDGPIETRPLDPDNAIHNGRLDGRARWMRLHIHGVSKRGSLITALVAQELGLPDHVLPPRLGDEVRTLRKTGSQRRVGEIPQIGIGRVEEYHTATR